MGDKNKANPMIAGIGAGAAETGLGAIANIAGMGLQRSQNKKLLQQEYEYNKKWGKFQNQLALEMWNKTNAEAQVKHYRDAGLNIGLMYGGSGSGGTMQQPSASASGGKASAPTAGGMGLQVGMQMALLNAQKENIEADTKLKLTDAEKKGGVDTDAVNTSINAMKQATKNAELQNAIMEYDKTIRAIEANVAGLSQDERLKQIHLATEKLRGEAQSAKAKGHVDEATQQNVITNANLVNQELNVKIGNIKASTENVKATTEQTKQKTENLKQDEIATQLDNELKQNGIQPTDNAAMRIVSRVITNTGTSLKKLQAKASNIASWLKGENGPQTQERFEEIWNQ